MAHAVNSTAVLILVFLTSCSPAIRPLKEREVPLPELPPAPAAVVMQAPVEPMTSLPPAVQPSRAPTQAAIVKTSFSQPQLDSTSHLSSPLIAEAEAQCRSKCCGGEPFVTIQNNVPVCACKSVLCKP